MSSLKKPRGTDNNSESQSTLVSIISGTSVRSSVRQGHPASYRASLLAQTGFGDANDGSDILSAIYPHRKAANEVGDNSSSLVRKSKPLLMGDSGMQQVNLK